MFENFPLFPEQASSKAGEVDALYITLIAISVFFTVAHRANSHRICNQIPETLRK